jgi:hypothetical protein
MATGPMQFGANNNAGSTVTRLLGTGVVNSTLEVTNTGGGSPQMAIQGSGAGIGVSGIGDSFGLSGSALGGPLSQFGTGVQGRGSRLSGVGVEGQARGGAAPGGFAGIGVRGLGNDVAVDGAGVRGEGNTGVAGFGQNGVQGFSRASASSSDMGVLGHAQQLNGTGVFGRCHNGPLAFGVWGVSNSGFAGFFTGNVHVTGNLTKGGTNSFRIDHPLDPENRYLCHASVESPEVLNVYSGNIVTDSEGNGVVQLPDYFEALNKDFRYQLTVIGEPTLAAVSEEVQGGQFRIKTDRPNVKVSWQVTGVRNDALMAMKPLIPEPEKSPTARGTYLHPEAFDQPITRGEQYAREQELDARLEQQIRSFER